MTAVGEMRDGQVLAHLIRSRRCTKSAAIGG